MGRQISHRQIELSRLALPLHEDKILRGGILGPGGARRQHCSTALPHRACTQGSQELLVQDHDFRLRGFFETATKLDRRSALCAGKLAIMQEAQAWQTQAQQCGRSVLLQREQRGDPRLIMIFEEVRAAGDQLRRIAD